MSWEDKPAAEDVNPNEKRLKPSPTEDQPPVDDKPKPDDPPKGDPPKDDDKPEDMVPQKLLGQVAKRIREKGRAEVTQLEEQNRLLMEENKRLKESSSSQDDDGGDDGSSNVVAEEVRKQFLQKEQARGIEVYGQEYEDAMVVVKAQNDPLLIRKILGSSAPADMVVKEARRIVEEESLGKTPEEREKKKKEKLKEEVRKEVEAELAEQLKAGANQPTDVQTIRSAGGDSTPAPQTESWETSLGH